MAKKKIKLPDEVQDIVKEVLEDVQEKDNKELHTFVE
jgi:hypothetical protein